MKVMAVVAHFDDEVLGCGGTLARLAREGHQVAVAICAHRRNGRALVGPDELRQYRQMAQQAAGFLGVTDLRFGEIPDEEFPAASWELMKWVEDQVEALQPDLVLTHAARDTNQDHGAVQQAVRVACRPYSGRDLLFFEVPSSTRAETFAPAVFYELTAVDVARKMEAWSCYATEHRPVPHPRSHLALDALMTVRGSQVGVRWAEAFEVGHVVVGSRSRQILPAKAGELVPG